jgi:hypothetical protein
MESCNVWNAQATALCFAATTFSIPVLTTEPPQ